MAPVLQVRCERPDGAAPQLEVQSEIANNFLRKQANEIRISGEPGVIIGKNFLRSCRSANVIVFFQQEHAEASPPKIAGGDESVMPRAQDHNVVFRFHPARAHTPARARARLNTLKRSNSLTATCSP